MLRILLLARDSNPDKTHGHLIGYSHAEALARLHAVTLVIHRDNEKAVRRAQGPFQGIEAVSLPWLDRIHAWCFRWIFRSNYFSQALTAFNYFFYLAFEWRAWQQTRARILAGDFDVVLRLCACFGGLVESFRFLSPARAHPLCNWSDQWWSAVAARFQPGQQAEGVDF